MLLFYFTECLFLNSSVGGVEHPDTAAVQLHNQALIRIDSYAVAGEFFTVKNEFDSVS